MSNDLVTVATFADPVEANLAKNRLEASGCGPSSPMRRPSTWTGSSVMPWGGSGSRSVIRTPTPPARS